MVQSTVIKSKQTCSNCEHYQNYGEYNGRGLCLHLDQIVYAHHPKTIDCPPSETSTSDTESNRGNIFANYSQAELEELSEAAFPSKIVWVDDEGYPMGEENKPDYQKGDLVKIIDSEEDHSEWASFQVTECHHNPERYKNLKSHLSETDWYFSLSSMDGSVFFLAAENEICKADMSWNVNTSDIF